MTWARDRRAGVWLTAIAALAAVGLLAFVSLTPVAAGRHDAGLVRRDDRGLAALAEARAAVADFQVWFGPMTALSTGGQMSFDDISQGTQLYTTATKSTDAATKTVEALGLTAAARELRSASANLTKSVADLSAVDPAAPIEGNLPLITAERVAFAAALSALSSADTQLRAVRDHDQQLVIGGLDSASAAVTVTGAVVAGLILLAGVVFGERARRRHRGEATDRRLATYEASLQDGLEMSKSEADVYAVTGLALAESVPNLRVEMLIADSSRAHFSRMLVDDSTDPADGGGGCGVISPPDCPSAARGHTLVFADSRAVNACPHLRNRPTGECSAACVPVSIGGRTVGVTHAWGTAGTPPARVDVRYLEVTSHRVSERLGMLRAFAKSESQARNDPLTGLWNRRSLENKIRDLQHDGVPFAVAYGDLDHFKQLNDTHGHGAGDQALRMFSRVLRDSIRPNDLAARYGGEEFIVVLPDCDTMTATTVLERVRERLALALTSGRVPAFTVSFGLASSTDADTFDEVVQLADQALLAAKAAGRNRVVVADDASTSERDRSRLAPDLPEDEDPVRRVPAREEHGPRRPLVPIRETPLRGSEHPGNG